MPTGPAACVGDLVAHPLPPVLTGAPGSPTVLIGGKPAWRGMPAAAAVALQTAKKAADTQLQAAAAATAAASGTPGAPGAKANEEATKVATAIAMTAMIQGSAGGSDIHQCNVMPPPVPPPIHGVGVVVDGSKTVVINGLSACRVGDTIVEAFGPPNKIVMGCPTVIIGG